jgi:phage protein D
VTPKFSLLAEGADITAIINARLLSLSVTDKAGVSSDTLTITIDDSDGLIAFPRKGAALELSLGYAEGPFVQMGSYTVDEVEVSGPPSKMTINAKAADMGGQLKAPQERSWHDKKLGEIAQKIAKENGLTPVLSDGAKNLKIEHADQTDSDLNFLSRIAAENGFVVSVKDKKLYIKEAGDGKGASGKNMPRVTLNANQLTSWRASATDRTQYKSVKATYQDIKGAQRGNVVVGSGQPQLTMRHTYASKANANRAAKAALDSSKGGTGEIDITLPGNPTIKPEQKLVVMGVRQGIDGAEYTIQEVVHNLDNGGYKTTIKGEIGEKKS